MIFIDKTDKPYICKGFINLMHHSTKSKEVFSRGQHLPPFGVSLSRGVKTLAHLKAGNQSVTS